MMFTRRVSYEIDGAFMPTADYFFLAPATPIAQASSADAPSPPETYDIYSRRARGAAASISPDDSVQDFAYLRRMSFMPMPHFPDAAMRAAAAVIESACFQLFTILFADFDIYFEYFCVILPRLCRMLSALAPAAFLLCFSLMLMRRHPFSFIFCASGFCIIFLAAAAFFFFCRAFRLRDGDAFYVYGRDTRFSQHTPTTDAVPQARQRVFSAFLLLAFAEMPASDAASFPDAGIAVRL